MRLSQFADYSLRVLILLASREDEATTAQAVAESYGISFHHVAKAAQFLAREGFVVATRGRGGGLRLGRRPAEISLGEVVRKAERGTALVECMKRQGNHCAITSVCRLAGALNSAQERFYQALEETTLADVTGNRRELRAALGMA